jgi:coniferyl-aldehyde dehydrogenase
LSLNDGAPPSASPSPSLEATFRRQREQRERAPARTRDEREQTLASLESLLRDNAEALCAALDHDFGGRSPAETRLLEIFPAIESLRYARRHLASWMRPRRARTNFWFFPGRSRVMPQPLGVVGIVVPWNYPIYLAMGPLAGALAAGNRAMVKMSEVAPATGELMQRLVAERFPADVLAVVNGGPEVARGFVALPFDHLLFTGSTDVGREVMRAAAANLTPVTLELGGKSPAIVGRGMRVAQAADRILFGKCLNAGQTCVAPDYVLVPEERVEGFMRAARESVARMYPKLGESPDYTAIVNARHRERLAALLAEARARGATLVSLAPGGESLEGSPKLAPVLVLGAPEDTRLMREEVFGPILPVVPYRTLDEAIGYVNARPRPLALYVFDHDRASVARVLAETVSGGACVNDTILQLGQDDLPFGGVGPSGMGEYHGRAGFDTFSKRKAVFYQSRLNGLKLLRPPYGSRFGAILRLLVR